MFKLVSSNFENSLSVYFNFKFENLLMTTSVTQRAISVSFIRKLLRVGEDSIFQNDLNLMLPTGIRELFLCSNFLKHRHLNFFFQCYLGVVQDTPVLVLVALVISTLPRAEKAHRKFPGSWGRFSITSCKVLKLGEKF